jgi:hypothetical protein
MSFLNVYQASFGQNIIFPFYKRATAIGICNLVARGITIAAPMVAELPKPYPACVMLFFSILQLIDVLFLPTYSLEVEFNKREDRILNKGVQKSD